MSQHCSTRSGGVWSTLAVFATQPCLPWLLLVLVGHTYTELNILARDVIGPMGVGSTARHAEVAVRVRLIGHTLHDVATYRDRRRRNSVDIVS